MTKAEMLELIKLLSALESWSFSEKHSLPVYLFERLDTTINTVTKKVLTDD